MKKSSFIFGVVLLILFVPLFLEAYESVERIEENPVYVDPYTWDLVRENPTGWKFIRFISLIGCIVGISLMIYGAISPEISPKSRDIRDILYAAQKGNIKKVKALINAGIDVNAEDKNGNTALMCAAAYGYTDTVNLLIDKGADVNARSNDGVTALMRVAWYGKTDVAKVLIKAGADLELKDNNEQTALMKAVSKGNTEIVNLLKAAGAKE